MNQRAEFTWKDTDGGLLVSVRGEIDHHTAAAIRTGMDALLFARRPARLVLDLSAVTFMDSSGIAVVLRVKKRMEETDGDVFLLDPAPQCARVLRTSGIERFVAIKFTEGKAAR